VKQTILASLAFSTLAYTAIAGSSDISGWQAAKWGMTPDEVQKVLGQRVSLADLAKVCGEPCNEGAALQLDDYDLNDQHFVVRLWFTKPDMHLHIVSMYAQQLDESNDNESFTKTKSFLENTYGSPQSVALKRGYFIVTWTLSATTINLYSNTTNELAIVYEERADEKAEKQ
jgi:CTP:phosphocholine cytidylyltransferase-like protein